MSFVEEITARKAAWLAAHPGETPTEEQMLEMVGEARKAVPPAPRVASDEDLDKLAADIMAGLVWFDVALEPWGPFSAVLGLAGPAFAAKLIEEQVTFFYEYLEKASPLAVNDKPMFLSFRYLNGTDHDVLAQKLEALKAEKGTG